MYDFTSLGAYMQELVEKNGVPCVGIHVRRNHETVYREMFGFSDAEGRRPMTGGERFIMYSCTKPVTVTAAMQLVERGLLDLDAPVSDYIEEYASLTLDKGGKIVPAERVMRVRHLFTMSGGLDYNLQKPVILDAVQKTGGQATTLDIVRALAKAPLCFEPGMRYQYSLCHDVLGGVVEAVSGKTLGEYMRENIFAPLGMEHTSFDMGALNGQNAAQQYQYSPENKGIRAIPLENPYCLSERYQSGGAGLASTLDDYSLFADALACSGVGASGNPILSRASIDEIRTEQLTKLADDPSFSTAAGAGYGYGLGVRTLVTKKYGQKSPLGEFGWDGAAGSYIMVDLENTVSIAFVMHVRGWSQFVAHGPLRDRTYEALGL